MRLMLAAPFSAASGNTWKEEAEEDNEEGVGKKTSPSFEFHPKRGVKEDNEEGVGPAPQKFGNGKNACFFIAITIS